MQNEFRHAKKWEMVLSIGSTIKSSIVEFETMFHFIRSGRIN